MAMTWELVLAFNIALLVAIASPGPSMLMLIRTSLVHGRTAGIRVGLGLGTMAAVWTAMALFGLDGVFKLFPWVYTTAKAAGAAYLLYLAWKTWRSADHRLERAQSAQTGRLFLEGMLVNLANPKSVLFAAAVLVVIFPPNLNLAEKAFIIGNHLMVEMLCQTTIALVMSTPAISRQYLAAKRYLDRTAAIVLGALGLRLLLQK
jgi:threonine/homoserine/homoserine lactone efflux protein